MVINPQQGGSLLIINKEGNLLFAETRKNQRMINLANLLTAFK